MRLKYIIGFIIISLASLFSCDPMHDIDKELDAKEEAEKGGGNSNINKQLLRTLEEADYSFISKAALRAAKTKEDSVIAKSVASILAFPANFAHQQFIPALIKDVYPGLGKGSSVLVTMNSTTEIPTLVKELTGIGDYKLTDADYADPLVNWFTPKKPTKDTIPDILASVYPNATDNDYVDVHYRYSSEEAALKETRSDIFSEKFDEGYEDRDSICLRGWDQYYAKGKKFAWQTRPSDDGLGAQFSSFKSGEDNETWLITPVIDLTDIPDAILTFKVRYKYQIEEHKPLTIKISDNYNEADPLSAEGWTDITNRFSYSDKPNTSLNPAGNAVLNDFANKKIRIAFVYSGSGISDPALTTTVLIDDIAISSVKLTAIPQADIIESNAIYRFENSKWQLLKEEKISEEGPSAQIYSVQTADYDQMGSATGDHDNFSSSAKPEDYLPQLLSLRFPFAQLGDQIVVVYKYYANKKTTNEANLYSFVEQEGIRQWLPLSGITIKEEQYLNNGKIWLFDPTITFSMVSADYQAIVDWVGEHKGEKWLDQKYKDNTEMWCGASSYYSNMDFSLAKRRAPTADPDGTLTGLSDEEAIALFHSRMANDGIPAVLTARYPDAPATINGVTQYYQVIYYVYPEKINYLMKFEGLGNADFKFIEGPIIQ